MRLQNESYFKLKRNAYLESIKCSKQFHFKHYEVLNYSKGKIILWFCFSFSSVRKYKSYKWYISSSIKGKLVNECISEYHEWNMGKMRNKGQMIIFRIPSTFPQWSVNFPNNAISSNRVDGICLALKMKSPIGVLPSYRRDVNIVSEWVLCQAFYKDQQWTYVQADCKISGRDNTGWVTHKHTRFQINIHIKH